MQEVGVLKISHEELQKIKKQFYETNKYVIREMDPLVEIFSIKLRHSLLSMLR